MPYNRGNYANKCLFSDTGRFDSYEKESELAGFFALACKTALFPMLCQ